MARAPRQADVAAAAGVSQTTVSLILSGNTEGLRLAESTRRRVLKAAEKLGYVPDPVATRLASARNHMIGVYTFASAFPTAVDGFYYPILAGIEEEAAALGQDLILFTGTGGLGARADDRTAIRRTRIADGCVFFGRHVPQEPIDWLLGGGFPLVYVGRRDELDGRIPFVGVDYVAASAAIVDRLVEAGHREIRYLRSTDDALSSSDREQGVRQAVAAAELPSQRLVVRAADAEVPGLVDRWRREGVTAIVAEETDTGSLSAALLAAVEGVEVPAELSIAVLGQPKDHPEVSGFEVPRRDLGRHAVRLLVEQITSSANAVVPQVLLECRPVEGSTIGLPRD
ncbi:LacI family DNA-binding transcriptional regulator [Kribbella sp. CA-293567]|uniref:LacI family DNA-binding transcriptional regulator n=1 Tax=Kribbella sp. CA-293567 TaxID=3002436 RepID=UPI0022DE83CD|nr:LacI family DNA-binding transcriptional regulator [Kribbella sp. CA-293567]WBQ06847.1 LacI family DNA-binding transcriptional regulator [Kribbella sp. CA-293567]